MSQLDYNRKRSADEFDIPKDLHFERLSTLVKVAHKSGVANVEGLTFADIEKHLIRISLDARNQWYELSNVTERIYYEYQVMKTKGDLFDVTGIQRLQMWEDERVKLKALLGVQ
jgi:hypothetical protein